MTGSFFGRIVFLTAGLLLWAAHFLFVYGFNGVVCARGYDSVQLFGFGLVSVVVIGATAIALALAVIVFALAAAGRGPGVSRETDPALRNFWRYVSAAVALVGSIAILWDAIPVLMIEPCA